MRGLEARAREAFDRRLLRASPRPVAVALSGGGDSLALALLADAWAREAGRDLIVLSVDHRLQPASRGWIEVCAAVAARLGRPFRELVWEGEKPASGLPAAARAARHRLLANAAREAGARVVLMGHTADDLREAQVMRAAGATTPDPREWAPSPVWPHGRGVFLLRPLVDVSRADLREWLAARGETWIEDPANRDVRFARSRARLAPMPATAPRCEPAPLALAGEISEALGVLTIGRDRLCAAAPAELRRLVAIAAVCGGGGERRPAAARIERVALALRANGAQVATLAGARIEADNDVVRMFREAGEAGRGGLVSVAFGDDRPVVWDGRFEVAASPASVEVRRLAGLQRRLPIEQQRLLRDLPPAARGALPALVGAEGAVTCPALAGAAVSLVGERLRAAAGLIAREPA